MKKINNTITPWNELVASGFPLSEYSYAEQAGEITATLVVKTEGRQNNILAYFDTADGGNMKISFGHENAPV